MNKKLPNSVNTHTHTHTHTYTATFYYIIISLTEMLLNERLNPEVDLNLPYSLLLLEDGDCLFTFPQELEPKKSN